MNRLGEKFKMITGSFCKRKLQQDQEKVTKANKSQIKLKKNKPKLKTKQPVKTMKQKNLCQKKKEIMTNQNGVALLQIFIILGVKLLT